MDILKWLWSLLNEHSWQRTEHPIQQQPPHLAKLKGVQILIIDCLLDYKHKGDAYHPLVIEAATDFSNFLENSSKGVDEPIAQNMINAGWITLGRIDLIESVIEALPEVYTGKITGYCVTLGSQALKSILPLPDDFRCGFRINCDKQKLKSWFNENKDRLVWDAQQEKFTLKTTDSL